MLQKNKIISVLIIFIPHQSLIKYQKHIIEAHKETIHVRSKTDVGSTFGFILPAGRG